MGHEGFVRALYDPWGAMAVEPGFYEDSVRFYSSITRQRNEMGNNRPGSCFGIWQEKIEILIRF